MSAPRTVTPLESEIAAIRGRTLVIPVRLEGDVPRQGTVPVIIGDGEPTEAALHWIRVVREAVPPVGGRPVAERAAAWLGWKETWSAGVAPAPGESEDGFWVITVDVPAAAEGRYLDVAGTRYPLNWLGEAPGARGVRSRTGDGSADSAWMAGALASAMRSPATRWRARLAKGELLDAAGAPAGARFDDPTIEAIARQYERRWRIGLSRLRAADPALAARVLARVRSIAAFNSDVTVPVWTGDRARLNRLLDLLLTSTLTEPQRTERIENWLEARPAVWAWVIDDAGAQDALTGATLTTLGVLNTGAEQRAVAVSTDGADSTSPDLAPAPPGEVIRIAAPVTVPTPRSDRLEWARRARRGLPVVITAGVERSGRAAYPMIFPAMPPGLSVGPLLAEWRMTPFALHASGAPDASGVGVEVDRSWRTVGRLFRETAPGAQEGSGVASGWTLFIQCAQGGADIAGGGAGGGEDYVRIWLGPFGSPVCVLRINRDGQFVDEMSPDSRTLAASTGGSGARVVREAGRWSCWAPIPARCVGEDGVLRLAVQRVDARGVMSTWPRPVLPWQAEPGRIAVDLTAWGDASNRGR